MATARLLVLTSLGLGIAWSGDTGSHVRRGNAAFLRKDFAAALSAYDQAQDATIDPGLVAFNKATALYANQQYAMAALEYQRSLEDAATWRRWQALYGLGNALTQEGYGLKGRRAVVTLTRAVDAYASCMRELAADETGADSALAKDALHNQQIAERLLAIKQAEAAKEPPNLDSSQNPDTNPGSQGEDKGQQTAAGNTQPGPQSNDAKTSTHSGAQPNTDVQTGGKGNLPPLPDTVDAPAIGAAEALEYLQQALDRMRQDRLRQGTTPTRQPRARDW